MNFYKNGVKWSKNLNMPISAWETGEMAMKFILCFLKNNPCG